MRPGLGQQHDTQFFQEALEEQADVFEEAVTLYRFTGYKPGSDPASGRSQEAVYDVEETSALVGAPTRNDLQLVAGIYQQGDLMLSMRFEARAGRDTDGQGGDQFEFWNERWRIVGLVHPVPMGGDVAFHKALVRRI
jgi:hypothetical protein